MDFTFDNDRPIYIQLVQQLKSNIVSGTLKPGDKLPSVRELAAIIQVNPNTVQKALQELEQDGFIYTERTNGKFVTSDTVLIDKVKMELARDTINSFVSDMEKLGFELEDMILYLQEMGGND